NHPVLQTAPRHYPLNRLPPAVREGHPCGTCAVNDLETRQDSVLCDEEARAEVEACAIRVERFDTHSRGQGLAVDFRSTKRVSFGDRRRLGSRGYLESMCPSNFPVHVGLERPNTRCDALGKGQCPITGKAPL